MARRIRRIWRWLLGVIPVLAILGGWGYRLLTALPSWYQPQGEWTAQTRLAADNAERKAQLTSEWAKSAAVEASGPAAATRPATMPGSYTVSFTQTELNAFFAKWDQWYGWSRRYQQYISEPAIVLRPGRVILAGKVRDLGAIASFHFYPRLDETGALRLTLVGAQAGRLPMPDALWDAQRRMIVSMLQARRLGWQQGARMLPGGSANVEAVKAAGAQLVLQMLSDLPGEPVLFIPESEGRAVPVKIIGLEVGDQVLTLSVQAMTSQQRAELIGRLKQSDSAREPGG
jgi:hypothetical protein